MCSARVGAGAAAFTNEMLPRVTADGFVGGYGLDPVDGEVFGSSCSRQRSKRRVPHRRNHLAGAGSRDDVRRVAVAIP